MSVYVINNMTITDRKAYDTYLREFMPVFREFEGEVLAATDAPALIEGEWPFDRTVLLRFPDRESLERWSQSEAYRAIAVHRHAGTVSNVVVLDGAPQRPR
ncbi:MAG: DUF1330 domain-containing protein [Casimicrobium sp.]